MNNHSITKKNVTNTRTQYLALKAGKLGICILGPLVRGILTFMI